MMEKSIIIDVLVYFLGGKVNQLPILSFHSSGRNNPKPLMGKKVISPKYA